MARHAKIDSGLQPGGRYLEIARKRRRSRLIKRIGIGVAAVIAVAVLAGGGYYLWFRASLDSALSKHTDANVFSSLDEAKSGAFYTLLLGSDIRHEDVVGLVRGADAEVISGFALAQGEAGSESSDGVKYLFHILLSVR